MEKTKTKKGGIGRRDDSLRWWCLIGLRIYSVIKGLKGSNLFLAGRVQGSGFLTPLVKSISSIPSSVLYSPCSLVETASSIQMYHYGMKRQLPFP